MGGQIPLLEPTHPPNNSEGLYFVGGIHDTRCLIILFCILKAERTKSNHTSHIPPTTNHQPPNNSKQNEKVWVQEDINSDPL